MAKMHRSASSGRFVKASTAARHPSRTVSERRGGRATGRSRSASTGRFVTKAYARRNPSTTVTES
ncbi:hypothetical protein DRW48_02655 [Paracoccus suum]|uniref:Uncharacterized protein n=1 Tax=Paracoccus suum TaxID=2259340 RepID=A0A344PH79_9RHOB|nr:hypothetical protein DRW48_02655 [Paracoccus suum]